MTNASFEWEDSGSALLTGLECRCGSTIVDAESGERYGLESHHAMPGYETFECDDCGRVYEPEWVGMKMSRIEGPRTPVTIEYARYHTRYYDAVESVAEAAGRLSALWEDGTGSPIAIYDDDGNRVWSHYGDDYVHEWACEQFGHPRWIQRDYHDDGIEQCARCNERREIE